MKEKKAPGTEEELLARLERLFDQLEPDTADEVDIILREAGLDPEEVGARMKAAAERQFAASPLNWRNKARQEVAEAEARLAKFSSTPTAGQADLRERIERLLRGLSATHRSVAAAYHRNLEEATESDLQSLLSELEYLTSEEGGEEAENQ